MPEPAVPRQPVEQPEPQAPVVVTPPLTPPKQQLIVDAGASPAPVDAGVAEPSFELTPIAGEPSLTESQVTPAITEVRRIVRQCYADVEKRYPPPQTLTLTFDVRADGERLTMVTPVFERSSIQDPFFEACVSDAPLDVQLPLSSAGKAHVRLPFRYSQVGE